MERDEMDSVYSVGAKALALLIVFIAPIQSVLFATGALVVADTLTGVWAALKEGQPLTSAKFKRVIAKSAAYMLAIVVGQIIEKYMVSEAVPIIKTITGLIAMTEGKSIMENLKRITGIDLWKALVDKLQGSSIKLPDNLK